jgi:NTP pyrophosphatase (non-canonical NTP hydrolase)
VCFEGLDERPSLLQSSDARCWSMRRSDQDTSVEEMKKWIQKFCEERNWDPYHGPKDLAIGLVTEGSELLELFRFVSEDQAARMMKDPEQRQKIADELADSLYFILRFAQMFGFDLSQAVEDKLVKNAKKYPAP